MKIKKIAEIIKRKCLSPIKYAKEIGVIVGDKCKFNGHPNFGTEPWLIELGNHVELSGNVNFITHDGSTWVFRDEAGYEDVIKYGKITIKDNCFIGYGTTILPGCTIEENIIVGASSLVTKSLEKNSVYAGVPAKKICSLDEFKEKCKRENPIYDKNNYSKNKKDELLHIYVKGDE